MSDGTFHLEIKGLDKLYDDFKKAGVNFEPIMEQAMVKSTIKIKNAIQENIRSKGITFQGSLGRSVQVRESTARRGVVAVGEKYGSVVEEGRRPGKMPPVAAIERWATIKLGAPGAGFVIARKIKQEGTKAQPFVEPAFRSESGPVLEIFKDASDQIFRMMAGT